MAQIPDLDAIIKAKDNKSMMPLDAFPILKDRVKDLMMEAMRQVLELAAEKATLKQLNAHTGELQYDGFESYNYHNPNGPDETVLVDKQSITGVIDLVKR